MAGGAAPAQSESCRQSDVTERLAASVCSCPYPGRDLQALLSSMPWPAGGAGHHVGTVAACRPASGGRRLCRSELLLSILCSSIRHAAVVRGACTIICTLTWDQRQQVVTQDCVCALQSGLALSLRNLSSMVAILFATTTVTGLGTVAMAGHEILRQIWCVSVQPFSAFQLVYTGQDCCQVACLQPAVPCAALDTGNVGMDGLLPTHSCRPHEPWPVRCSPCLLVLVQDLQHPGFCSTGHCNSDSGGLLSGPGETRLPHLPRQNWPPCGVCLCHTRCHSF